MLLLVCRPGAGQGGRWAVRWLLGADHQGGVPSRPRRCRLSGGSGLSLLPVTWLLVPFDLLWCAAPGYGWARWRQRGRLACRSWADRRCPDRAQLAILEVMRRTTDWQLGGRAAVKGPGEVNDDGAGGEARTWTVGRARPRGCSKRRPGPGGVAAVPGGAAVPALAPALGGNRCRGDRGHARRRARARPLSSMPGPGPSPSRPRPSWCGPGSCSLAPGGPASTAMTCSTTPPGPAPTNFCLNSSRPGVGDWVPMSRQGHRDDRLQRRGPWSPTGGYCGPSRTAPGHGPSARSTVVARGW